PDVEDDVVNDYRIARADFDVLYPFILSEPGGHNKVSVLNGTAGRDWKVHGEFDDGVWPSHHPAFGERLRFRGVLRIALFRTRIDPGHDAIDIGLRHAAIVGEAAVSGIGKPRRHFADDHSFANGFGPRACLLIGEQRHRRGFAGPVAALTSRLKN